MTVHGKNQIVKSPIVSSIFFGIIDDMVCPE